MTLAKMKAGVKSSLFGCDVSSKTSPLSYIVIGFVVSRWSWCFCAILGAPFLERAVGARPQSSQPFSIVSLGEAKLQQIFAHEFPQIAQVTDRKDPTFTLAIIFQYQTNSRSLENTETIGKPHCRVSGDVSSIPRPDHCPQHVASQREVDTSVQVQFLPQTPHTTTRGPRAR